MVRQSCADRTCRGGFDSKLQACQSPDLSLPLVSFEAKKFPCSKSLKGGPMSSYKSWLKLMATLACLNLGSTKVLAAVPVALTEMVDALWKGLTEPILGMQHLLFGLMAGLLAFTMTKKPKTLLVFLLALVPGYALEWWSPMPVLLVKLAAATSVAVLLGMLWFHEKLGRFAPLVFVLGGLIHGLGLAQEVRGSNPSEFLIYVTTASLVQLVICFGFGRFTLQLSTDSPDSFEGLENILSATATGVAISYFVLAF